MGVEGVAQRRQTPVAGGNAFAGNDDEFGVENVNQISNADTEPASRIGEQTLSELIAGFGRRHNPL